MRQPLGIWASGVGVCIASAFSANAAFAQTPPPTAAPAKASPSAPPTLAAAAPAPAPSGPLPPAPPVYTQVTTGSEAPPPSVGPAEAMPARVGFQMAFRTGYALPMGKVDDADRDEMSNFYSGQVPIFVEVGGKPSPYIFLGGYFGLGFGGTDGMIADECSSPGASCATVTARTGFEILGYFTPGEKTSPWLGYGIGFEATSIAISAPRGDGSLTASGFEFAHFMGGVDFRLSKGFGLGPFIDLSIAEFSELQVSSPTIDQNSSLRNKAIHEWLAFGVRGVVFP